MVDWKMQIPPMQNKTQKQTEKKKEINRKEISTNIKINYIK